MSRPPVVEPASRWLAHALLALAVGLPAAAVGWLAFTPTDALLAQAGGTAAGGSPSEALRAALALLGLLPVAAASASLLFARRCFLAFARGEHFSRTTVHALRQCARAMCAAGALGLAVPTLCGVLASGGHRLSVHVGSGQLLTLVFAGVVWQVASAFARGMALADENAQFV